jgi:hypothetical protein
MGFKTKQIFVSIQELALSLSRKTRTKQIIKRTEPFRCATPFIQAMEEQGITVLSEMNDRRESTEGRKGRDICRGVPDALSRPSGQ